MIAIGFHHPRGFGFEHRRDARIGEVVPHAAFGLDVESEFVGRAERCIRRAPGMEADAVQAIILADLDDLFPARDVGRRIAGQGKSPPECVARISIGRPLRSIVRSSALICRRPKVRVAVIVSRVAGKLQRQVLKIGMIFVPGLGAVAKWNDQLGVATFGIPLDVDRRIPSGEFPRAGLGRSGFRSSP